jgi:integrase
MAKALTAAAVEKLKANPEKRLEIPDGLLPGLYLVIQPAGAKSWAVRYRIGGKPKKLTIGGYPLFGVDKAREAARAALMAVQAGNDPAADKRAAKRNDAASDLFEDVARQFIDRYAKPKNREWKGQARLLGLVPDPDKPEGADNPRTFIIKADSPAAKLEGRSLGSIRKRDLLDIMDAIVDRGTAVSANRVLTVLKRLFSWAVERDIIDASPAAAVKAPTAETPRDRVLSDDELRAVWLAAEAIGWPFGPAVKLLILTGQRRDEVGEMAWSEIADTGNVWSIPASRSKNKRAHDVPLSEAAQAILATVPRVAGEGQFVFTTTGQTPISGWSRAKTILDKKALEILKSQAEDRGEDADKVQMPDWRLHDLRRTTATGLARLGIDLPTVEKLLNHVGGSFAGVAGIYQRHSFAEEKRRALETWASFVSELVTGKPKGNVTPMRRAAE